MFGYTKSEAVEALAASWVDLDGGNVVSGLTSLLTASQSIPMCLPGILVKKSQQPVYGCWRWLVIAIIIRQRPIACPVLVTQTEGPAHEVAQLAGPKQAKKDDRHSHGHGCCPVSPLIHVHIAHVASIHAKDAGNGAKRQEDHRHDGEGVDGVVVAVLGRVDLVAVL